VPKLGITLQGITITLNWPAWATNYTLQEAEGTLLPAEWRNAAAGPTTTSGQLTVQAPIERTNKFYRLNSATVSR